MLTIILLVLALVLFALAAINVSPPPRFNFVGAGLAALTLFVLLRLYWHAG